MRDLAGPFHGYYMVLLEPRIFWSTYCVVLGQYKSVNILHPPSSLAWLSILWRDSSIRMIQHLEGGLYVKALKPPVRLRETAITYRPVVLER